MIRTREIRLSPAAIRRVFSQEGRRSVFLWLLTVAVAAATVLSTMLGYHFEHDFALLESWLPVCACVAVWWLLFLWVLPWMNARSAPSMALCRPMRLSFSPAGIRQEFADGSAKTIAPVHVALRSSYAVVRGRDKSTLIVPFDVFHNEDELEQVRRWLSP